MNKIFLMGRLITEPEFSRAQSGTAVCKFNIAVDRQYTKGEEKKADFFQIITFGKTAEFVNKFFTKGKPIVIEGKIQNNNYQGKDGKMQYHNQIIADNVSFTISDTTKQSGNNPPAHNAPNNDFSSYQTLIADGNMPF